jgi:hypothetical protein
MALLLKYVPRKPSTESDELKEYNRHLRRMEKLEREIDEYDQRGLAKLILAELEKRLKRLYPSSQDE